MTVTIYGIKTCDTVKKARTGLDGKGVEYRFVDYRAEGLDPKWLAEWRKFPGMTAVRNGRLASFSDERIDRMGPSVIAATGGLCEVIDRARGVIPAM